MGLLHGRPMDLDRLYYLVPRDDARMDVVWLLRRDGDGWVPTSWIKKGTEVRFEYSDVVDEVLPCLGLVPRSAAVVPGRMCSS